MYVRRLRLDGVKALCREIPATGEAFPEPARKRLLLQGAHGSGKTTILESIRLLWEMFGEWIDHGRMHPEFLGRRHQRDDGTEVALQHARLAAMEVGDLPTPGGSLWIGLGTVDAWEDLKQKHPGAQFAGWVRDGREPVAGRIDLPPGDWQTFRQRSMVGAAPQPNIVSFSQDDRIVAARRNGPRLVDVTQLNWSAHYNAKLDLDSLLLTVKALRPQDYDETLRLVNQALQLRQKHLIGFGDNGRLVIEGQTDFGTTYRHPPEQLSASERQILLLVAYTVGFLRPGGILLVDEPDLHIPWAMVGLLLDTLYKVVRERGGQLIIVSVGDRVGDWFTREQERIDLTPWRGAKV